MIAARVLALVGKSSIIIDGMQQTAPVPTKVRFTSQYRE